MHQPRSGSGTGLLRLTRIPVVRKLRIGVPGTTRSRWEQTRAPTRRTLSTRVDPSRSRRTWCRTRRAGSMVVRRDTRPRGQSAPPGAGRRDLWLDEDGRPDAQDASPRSGEGRLGVHVHSSGAQPCATAGSGGRPHLTHGRARRRANLIRSVRFDRVSCRAHIRRLVRTAGPPMQPAGPSARRTEPEHDTAHGRISGKADIGVFSRSARRLDLSISQ